MRVFLDTNVFIYGAGAPSPYKTECVALLQRVAAGELDATTSVEVVQEIHHVFRRRGRLAEGIALGREVLLLFPEILTITREDVVRAGALLTTWPQLSPRDALHAASALNHGIGTMVSVDKDFDQIEGLVRIDPSAG